MASSANMEQCNLTGGRHSSLAMSVFLILLASSISLPFTHSVAKELEAIAEPQPNVLNYGEINGDGGFAIIDHLGFNKSHFAGG